MDRCCRSVTGPPNPLDADGKRPRWPAVTPTAAQTIPEYLTLLSAGRGVPHGVSGNYRKLTLAIVEIGWSLMREKNWALLLAPLFLAVPGVIFANTIREYAFAEKWSRRLALREVTSEARALETI
jgi:hypothetical protein